MKNYMDIVDELGRVWVCAYEGEAGAGEAGAGDAGAGDAGVGDAGKLDTKTQDQLNRVLADEKKKYQQNLQKAMDEVTLLRKRTKLSDDERKDMDKRLETIQQEMLTKEELSKRDNEKKQKKYESEVSNLTTERDSWQKRYTDTLINHSITEASAKHKAYNPRQVIAILRPSTKLEEAVDGEGNPTGELVPKVDFQDKDKEGKPISLKLSVSDAIKRMADMEDYGNLFQGEGVNGLGDLKRGKGETANLQQIASGDPKRYREMKEKGLITLQ